ncbi:lipopolysaccharide biosynthesis protein [Fibrella forsythiae]|uniref:Polysaccharide biosynthesis C-terminal domain-containing protein n=1 Tax=Fibrella forsythiae TaxID=2817061 RepID=A0ABS3JSF9_9BACT|nr:polysaccharide biosynthesis C-terminal domain-containing protein [Fibrella forsythiae]MBO0952321.1 polysaccharide biosynthesis C-terminal domain-containing protein [Fibrella forsythiae]
MPIATTWQRFSGFLADTWRQTAYLWGAQGVSALTGVAYGKLVALFVAPAVLGVYNLQLASTLVLHAIVVAPTIQAYMSAMQQYAPNQTQRFYTRLLTGIYGVALLGTLAFALISGAWFVAMLMWLATTLQGAFLLNNGYFTAFGHVRKLALTQALNPLANLSLLALLIVSGRVIDNTMLWANVVALNGLLWVVSFYYLRRQRSTSTPTGTLPARRLAEHLRHYCLPLVIQAIFSWLTNYGDRYLVGMLMTETAVGYYSAGYGMGARIAILGAPLLVRQTVKLYANRREGLPVRNTLSMLRKNVALLWLMGGGGIVLLIALLDIIGNLFLSAQYQPGFSVIPLIAVAYLLLTTSQLIEASFMAYEKTKYILANSVCTALSNISLNMLLIPPFGIQGAAYAMILSMLVQCLIATGLYRRLLTVPKTHL